MLATYLPWFYSVARSLIAGFWEESLFRAVPLATAALIGRRVNREKTYIGITFVVQALIFAAAHANYPTQPFYARLIELILPSFMFGAVYLLFGLLPSIISHFVYDAVLMSLPIFIASSSTMWVNQVLVLIGIFVPFFIVIWARIRYGSWHELAQSAYNKAWKPAPVVPKKIKEIQPDYEQKQHPLSMKIGFALSALGCIIWFFVTPFKQDGQALNMRRNTVIQQTQKALQKENVSLKGAWQELTKLRATFKGVPGNDIQHRYVWDIGGKKLYEKLLNSYLLPAAWVVRTVTFEGSVSERAEEYQHIFTDDGLLVRTAHKLPEDRPGKTLTEEQARTIAYNHINTKFKLTQNEFKEISAVSQQRPHRRDWVFTVADIKTPKPSEFNSDEQLRIGVIINGDEVVDTFRYIHVPEEWARTERNNQMMTDVIMILCKLILGLFLAACIVFAMRRKKTGISAALISRIFLAVSAIYFIATLNRLPAVFADFNTSEPFMNQLLMHGGKLFLTLFFVSSTLSYLLARVMSWYPPRNPHSTKRVAFGYAIGLCIATIFAVLDYLEPSIEPLWAEITQLNTYSPLVSTIAKLLSSYLMTTVFVYLLIIIFDWLSGYWTRRKVLTYLVSVGIGICVVQLPLVTYVPFWLGAGTVVGLLIVLLYQFVVRFDYALVPLVTGALFVTQHLQQLMFNAYPAARIINVYAIGILVLLSSAWYMTMTQAKKVH